MKTTYIKFPHKDADKRLREALDQLRRERIRSVVLGVIAAGLAAVIAVMCTYQLATIEAAAVKTEADKPEITLTEPVEPAEIEAAEPKLISLGEFKITHYCACVSCCGKDDGITSTGVKAVAGRTIAVDPKVIPYGTVLYIDGEDYVAEDCGGAIKGNRLDIYCDSHEEALQRGVKYAEVFAEK